MIYDELIKNLRFCVEEGSCRRCEFDNDMNCYDTLMAKAADAIEELEKENEKLHDDLGKAIRKLTTMRWIPVTERLPEKHDRVLVYSKATRMGRSIDFINSDRNWYTTPKVTHWMPLPEPPESEVK